MNDPTPAGPGRWTDGVLPANVRLGPDTLVSSDYAFKRFRTRRSPGLVVGARCTMDATSGVTHGAKS